MAEAFVTLRPDLKGFEQEASSKIGGALKVGAAAGVAALAGIGAASVMMAADFDKGMREVNTLIGLSESELNKLKSSVLDLSKEMGVATSEAVPALYQAISAGVPQDNAIDFLRVASMTAIGGVTDLETAVDGLTTAMNAYQIPVEEAERVSDILFVGMKGGKTTIEELSGSLFQAAPIAHAAGVSLEETVAAMSALTTGGVPTSVAATQVSAAISAIIKPGGDMAAVFEEAGFASGQLAIEQLGLEGAMRIVSDAAGGEMGALQQLTGRKEGAMAIQSLLNSSYDTYNDLLEEMNGNSGQTREAFEEMNRSASRQWDILKNQLNVAMIQLGSALLPLVTAAMGKLVPIIGTVIGAMQTVIDVVKEFVGFLGAVSREGEITNAMLEKLPSFLQPIAQSLAGFIEFLKEVVRSGQNVNGWLDDIDPRFQGIAKTIASVVLVVKDVLVPAFLTGAETIGKAIFEMGKIILPVLEGFFNFVISNKPVLIAAVTAIGIAIALALGPGTVAVLAILGIITLVGLVKDNWDGLKAKTEEVFNSLPGPVQWAMTFIKDHVMAVVGGIIQFFEGALNTVLGIFDFWAGIFTGDWQRAWDGLKQALDGILDMILGAVSAQFGAIPGTIAGLAGEAAGAAWTFAQGIFNSVVEWAEQLPDKVGEFIGKIPGAILDAMGSVADAAWSLGKSILDSIINGIGDIAGAVQRKVTSGIQQGLSGAVGAIPGVGAAVGIGGAISGLFRASGGPVTGGMPYIVGERGPELFVPRSSGTVVPNHELGVASGETSITVNNYGPIYARDRDDADRGMRDVAFALQSVGVAT